MSYKEATIERVAEWCPDVAALRDERNELRLQVEAGRIASLALHNLTQSALTRGYDRIADAIAAAPVKSTGYQKW